MLINVRYTDKDSWGWNLNGEKTYDNTTFRWKGLLSSANSFLSNILGIVEGTQAILILSDEPDGPYGPHSLALEYQKTDYNHEWVYYTLLNGDTLHFCFNGLSKVFPCDDEDSFPPNIYVTVFTKGLPKLSPNKRR